MIFQPTLPVRGATRGRPRIGARTRISTHAPRAGSDPNYTQKPGANPSISTHAPRAGSDAPRTWRPSPESISTHAPRAGSDAGQKPPYRSIRHFNPRSPCGERLQLVSLNYNINENFNPRSPCGERQVWNTSFISGSRFQPTLPVRGATRHRPGATRGFPFQPTLPVRGATRQRRRTMSLNENFNPRSPCGERR